MALNKEIIQPNTVKTTYHRIVRLDILVNVYNFIEVASYVDYDARKAQIVMESSNEDMGLTFPYIYTSYYDLPYDESMSIIDAYNYLKTIPEFEGAEDIFDSEEQKAEALSLNEE